MKGECYSKTLITYAIEGSSPMIEKAIPNVYRNNLSIRKLLWSKHIPRAQ